MHFIRYLSLKYKLSSSDPTKPKSNKYGERIAGFFLYLVLVFTIYFIVKLLSESIQENMNKYTLGLFAFLCVISISSAINKYYKEYFYSPEREILLIVPIKRREVILSRFLVVMFEVLIINVLILFSFVLANYFAGNLSITTVLITVFQVISLSIFSSSIAHIIFSIAYFLSKGRQLKLLAYSIMTGSFVVTMLIIIYMEDYKNFFLTDRTIFINLFYVLFKYPQILLIDHINYTSAILFILLSFINATFFLLIAYFLTNLCYKDGFLTLTSKDTNKPLYSNTVSNFINRKLKNNILKKDFLYIIRNIKLFSVFISPFLFLSLVEFKNNFASSGVFLTILINIVAAITFFIMFHIVFSDDLTHKELLFITPLNINDLFTSRSLLLHGFSFLVSSTYITLISIIQSVRWEIILFGIMQLCIITYIPSKVFLSRIIKSRFVTEKGYWYTGEKVKDIIYYIIVWNIPLTIIFSILHAYLNIYLNQGFLSLYSTVFLVLIIAILLVMIFKSKRKSI